MDVGKGAIWPDPTKTIVPCVKCKLACCGIEDVFASDANAIDRTKLGSDAEFPIIVKFTLVWVKDTKYAINSGHTI